MITLDTHIKLMQRISANQSAEDFLDTLKPLERLDFIKDSIETYPIQDNVSGYQGISKNKRVYTTIDGLVLGQFIMLEQIITGKTQLPDYLIDLEIAKLIIRPKHHEEFDNENLEDEKKNQEDILAMPVLEVYALLNEFIENRDKTLFKDFSGVFYDPKEDEDEEDEIEQQETSEMVFSQQWYWYSIVRMLAGEDITKYGEIYMLPMSTVLPEMSYLAQRNKIEAARERQSRAMSKL